MKHIRFILIFYLISLPIFYVGASLISGEINIVDMSQKVRSWVFGSWLVVMVLGYVIYAAENSKD